MPGRNFVLIVMLFLLIVILYFFVRPLLPSQFVTDTIIVLFLLDGAINILANLRTVIEKSERVASQKVDSKTWLARGVFAVKRLVSWIILNSKLVQFILGLAILVLVTYGVFTIYRSFLSIFLLVGFFVSLVLLHEAWPFLFKKTIKTHESQFEFIHIPPGFGNAYIREKYMDLAYGKVKLGDAEYIMEKDGLIFDTGSQIRYSIEDNDTKYIELSLQEPLSNIKSLFFLINSGNSHANFLGEKVGSITCQFSNGVTEEVELVLGKNLREWSPGNLPERNAMVNETTDPRSRVVWRGVNHNGRYAVIDQLEVPINEVHRNLLLEKIVFKHKGYNRPGNAIRPQYMIYAITVEFDQ